MRDTVPIVDVVGVGLNATDTLIILPHFPAADSKVHFEGAQVLLGGQVGTAMVACQAWGLRTRYVGTVGDDEAARLQAEAFAHAGVEAHLFSVPGCLSQCAYILVDARSGERTILWRRDPRLELRPEQLQREWIVRARALHVDGHDPRAAACAARWGREAGIPVTADVDNIYPGLDELVPLVDYLVASSEFPERLTGEPDLRKSLPTIAAQYGCKVAAATLGCGGVLAWGAASSAPTEPSVAAGFHYCPAFRVETTDTTGAGDVFHGAFIYGVVQGWPLDRILEFSCAAAALNCTALGARGGIRPLAEIERLIREGARHSRSFGTGV